MPISNTTQFANRYGLNIKVYDSTSENLTTELMSIDFANVSDISISSDRVWATGGQDHANKIGFNNVIEGPFTLSTQIMTMELLALMAGKDPTTGAVKGEGDTYTVVFDNTTNSMPKYFTIVAETVWQDANGVTYAETLTFHKACPKRAFNMSYSGDGDPTSIDIEFDLMQDKDGKVLTVEKADVK